MYDMYPWNQPGAAAAPRRDRRTGLRRRVSAPPPAQAAEALQVALDRRDNGGESRAASGQ